MAKTRDYLASFKREELEGSEERTVTLKVGGNDVQFQGSKYLLDVAMPNFYFHITTAYAIMRHNGVPLGKGNFLGRD